jgi:outer membrane protein OmpA-like peptidoglycan-associated protein
MKRTLLLASIAFIPTLALAQPPALPERPLVLAQSAMTNDKADANQDQKKQNRVQQRQDRRDDRQNAQQQRHNDGQNAQQQKREDKQNAQQQKREDKQKAQQQKRDDRQDARQDKREDKPNAAQQKANEKANDSAQDARQQKQQDTRQQKQPDDKQNARQERREDKQDARKDRREDKQDVRQDHREDKQDARKDRREEKQDARQERREDRRLDAVKAERKETKEGNRTVIKERDRTIIREGNRTIIRHDDTERFRRAGANEQVVRRGDRTERIIVRPGGVRVVSVYNAQGQLVRRTRVVNGREYVLFTNTPAVGFGFIIKVPPPVIHIPRERYIVEYRSAPRPWIYETLVAPPVMPIERAFTLDQVRYNYDVRARMPRIDIDSITFDTGSWDIRPDQAAKLQPIAEGMMRAIQKNPNEVYLIEGHTDAVGSEDDNLSLSDRRAPAVAEVLSEQFQVPPENMIPQGYGEQNLKVDNQGPEERNRYVSVRRVTPLLAQQEASGQAPRQ